MIKNIIIVLYNIKMYDYLIKEAEEFFISKYNVFIFHSSQSTIDLYPSYDLKKLNDKIRQIDISYLPLSDIENRFNEIHPIVVIFYTYQSYYDFVVKYFSDKTNIRTILHDHGIIFGNSVAGMPLKSRIKKIKRLSLLFIGIIKYSIQTLNFKLILDFYRIYIKRDYKKSSFKKYLLFCQNNLDVYKKLMTLENGSFTLSGYPIFKDNISKIKYSQKGTKKKVLYIKQPFIKNSITYIDLDEELNYIRKIGHKVNQFGYQLEVRLHPIENYDDYKILINDNILVNSKNDLIEQIAASEIIIGHYSTALIASIVMKRPTIILAYPKMVVSHLNNFDIFKQYAIYIEDVSLLNFDFLLKQEYKPQKEIYYLSGNDNTYESNFEILLNLIEN